MLFKSLVLFYTNIWDVGLLEVTVYIGFTCMYESYSFKIHQWNAENKHYNFFRYSFS